ncbi:type I-E CRISPR-associated protein Cas6/Cse3/CasE [Streptomyces bobili]
MDLKSSLLVLVVQSRVPADWSRVPTDALKEKPRTLNVDRVLKAGDSLTFRTVVNPTRAASPGKDATEKKIRGKRIAHTTAHHARAWFTQRLQPAGEPAPNPKGVARIGAAADPEKMLGSLRSTARDGLALSRAEIKGRLTVTDPEALVSALSDGISRARAYGCGLLLVR